MADINRHILFRLASTTESVAVYFMILLLEWYTILFGVALVDELFFTKIYLTLESVTVAICLILILQTVELRSLLSSPKYVEYLAIQASRSWDDSYSDFSTNLHFFRLHLIGLFRIGNGLSGGRFDNLVLYSFKPAEQDGFEGRCKTVMVRSIVIDMAEKASNLSDPIKDNPFMEYSAAIGPVLSAEPIRVSGLRDFIVSRYSSVPQKFKTNAKNRNSLAKRLERYPELAKLIIWGIVLFVVSIASAFLDASISW